MEDDDHKELQLLPTKYSCDSPWPSDSIRYRSDNAPSLDLQLSISLRPADSENGRLEAVKWHAEDQVRIATMEKAYAERVREMTRREMELAQSEFSRARHMWERAREDVARVEKLKERATRRIDSSCMEITCQACRQIFRY
ncbi:protein indeterminate-domain 14-like [Bidens hawaiensis]|uniref:protein indeterminate-domain 14-like n=1 Tax=Bidens hawaiensis TaxID=980011 RepID=UPI00404B520D